MNEDLKKKLGHVGDIINAAILKYTERLKSLDPLDDVWIGNVGFIRYDDVWTIVYTASNRSTPLTDCPLHIRIEAVEYFGELQDKIRRDQEEFMTSAWRAFDTLQTLALVDIQPSPVPASKPVPRKRSRPKKR